MRLDKPGITTDFLPRLASASADLLDDLESGYLLGVNPRRQFITQFLGVFPRAIV
ncbi:MAG: hypothetical protein ABI193_26115 [Minicystis sp.]